MIYIYMSRYLIFIPLAIIKTQIGFYKNSITMTFAIFKIPFIYRTIVPRIYAITVLLVLLPLSLVVAPIGMKVFSITISLIIYPLPYINIAIGMKEFSLSMSFIHFPLTFVFSPISPYLNAISVLHVI